MNRKQFLKDTFEALQAQGKFAYQRYNDGNGGTCVYRAPDGSKCAFGFHIPDEEYSTQMEGQKAHAVLDSYPKVKAAVESKYGEITLEDDSFINSVQRELHDQPALSESQIMLSWDDVKTIFPNETANESTDAPSNT